MGRRSDHKPITYVRHAAVREVIIITQKSMHKMRGWRPCAQTARRLAMRWASWEEAMALSTEGPGARVGASADERRLAAQHQKLDRLLSVATSLGVESNESAAKIRRSMWRALRHIRDCMARASGERLGVQEGRTQHVSMEG